MLNIVNICNIALAHIRASSIDSLDEASEAARKCKLLYDNALDYTLRDFNWNFALKITALALVDEKIPGWRYVCQYPSDCLQVRRVFNSSCANAKQIEKYRIMSSAKTDEKRICCNLSNAYMEYTARIKNPEVYDSKFINAFAWKLASDLAMPLTASAQLAQFCAQTYMFLINSAKADNANEGYDELKEPRDYINARR